MKYNYDLSRIARNTTNKLEEELSKAGIFYRIFFRCKTDKSLNLKLSRLNGDGELKYDASNKLIRDIIGIRINLYYVDDLVIITNFLKDKYKKSFVEEMIDQNDITQFKPTRVNLIFKLEKEFQQEFNEIVQDKRIDYTYELQLRTVISEGWHEVEHDLRYKCPDDWNDHSDLSRMLNGILASLELNEWGILKILETLCYQHYKNGSDSAMIRSKLRIRFEDFTLNPELGQIIKNDDFFRKEFFKIDREKIILFLLRNYLFIPLTLENIIFVLNFYFIKNAEIERITPEILTDVFNNRTVEV